MTTLSNSSLIAIGDSTPAQESLTISVLPVAGFGEGKGRLIHPTLGTIDYEFAPDRWRGHNGDLVIPPVWSVTSTLAGAIHALWAGKVADVEVSETWEDEIAMRADELLALQAFWQTPPDPALGTPSGFVQWWPSYASSLGFYVAILDLSVGPGGGFDLSKIADGEWVEGPVSLTMRVVARIE